MVLSAVLAFLKKAPPSTTGTAAPLVRVISGICALIMVLIIIFKRKAGAKKDKDDT